MLDLSSKCLALTFSVLILGQAYLVRRVVGTWLFPACLFGLFWFVYTFIPLAFLLWVPVEPYAVVFIFICTLSFSISSLFFNWKRAFLINKRKCEIATRVYSSSFLKILFHVSAIGCLIFLCLDLSDQGISLHDVFFNLQESATKYANLLYSDSLNDNIFGRLSTLFSYVGPSIGGLIFSSTPTKARRVFILIFSFLPSILVAFTQTSKGLLFLCIVLFFAGVLVRRLQSGTLELFDKGNIKSAVISIITIIPIITIAFFLRNLNDIVENEILIEKLTFYYATYSCGHLYAFSDWFTFFIGKHSQLVYANEGTTFGYYTFTSLFKMMGSTKVLPLGVFDEYYSYGNLLTSNIYTIFRGLILDFGFTGTFIFMFVIGLLFHTAFHVMLIKKRPVVTVVIFIFMMNFFYNSFIVSILAWNRMYAAFVLLWVILYINTLFIKKENPWFTSSSQIKPSITF